MTSRLGQADRLSICNAVGILILVLAAAAAVLVFADAAHRSDRHNDQGAQLVSTLAITRLSPVPSGRALRTPDLTNSAADGRYDPQLGGIQADPADLILNVPD